MWGYLMKHLDVVAAIILHKDKILCMQRGAGPYEYLSYKYEFPGGKVEAGESNIQALMRELAEELNFKTDISEDAYFMTVEHQYPDFIITLHCYICEADSHKIYCNEHVHHEWLYRDELDKLDWAPADYPVILKLMSEHCAAD